MIEEWVRIFSEIANYYGISHRVTSIWRTRAEQARLFRTPRRRLPAAAPGTSTHEYGLAFDVVADDPSQQAELGAIGQELGLYWGAAFGDPVHFQVIDPASWAQIIG